MKKVNIILVIFAFVTVGSLILVKEKYQTVPVNTCHPVISTIQSKVLISGNVYPIKEIEVKSFISGVLETVHVKIGEHVNAGEELAKVKLVPSPSEIENARVNQNLRKIEFMNMKNEYLREKELYEKGVVSLSEYEEVEKQYKLAEEQYESAKNKIKLLLDGYINETDISNVIKSPIDGTVIELPMEVGSSVIERNNFNVGSTLVVVAQMDYFVFKGKVNEVDLIKLNVGMPVEIGINALVNEKIKATIDKIYPRGVEEQGMIKYTVDAKFKLANNSVVVRPGYTATAEIVLEKKENIVCMNEKDLLFINDSCFVEILDNNVIKKQPVKTGISDGMMIEVTEGLRTTDEIVEKNR